MKTRTTTIYQCEYCPRPKTYLREGACKRHEEKCKHNPINFRACMTCQHLFPEEVVVGKNFGGVEVKQKMLVCPVLQLHVYPPVIERLDAQGLMKHNHGKYPDTPMPKTCNHHKPF